jgi:hypothetical protein
MFSVDKDRMSQAALIDSALPEKIETATFALG